MTFTSFIICCQLASAIHGTDNAIRYTARQCRDRVSREHRPLVRHLARSLWIRKPMNSANSTTGKESKSPQWITLREKLEYLGYVDGSTPGLSIECLHDHKLIGTGAVFYQSTGLLQCNHCKGWQLIRKPVK